MKAINRLYQYFDFKNIKPTRFEKDCGLSNGYFGVQLKRRADIGSAILEIVVNNCRDLNIEWLITGDGSMLKELAVNSHPENIIEESSSGYNGPPCEKCNLKDTIIANQEREIASQAEFIKYLQSNSPANSGQKRKGSSSGYGNSKLSEAI